MDFYFATKECLQRTEWPQISALSPYSVVTVTPTVFRPVLRGRDADNFWTGMKSALDGVATAIGVNDSMFALMPVTWTKGQDRTVLTLEIMD